MIDPLSPKKIEPVRSQPSSLSGRKTGGTSVTVERPAEGNTVTAQLLDISASTARQGAPVDKNSVEALRSAIANGEYQINPRGIAQAMVEFASAGRDS